MPKIFRVVIWIGIAVLGAFALATIALRRGEQINAMWLVVAAFCTYALGYRFYSKFIAAKVLALDGQRAQVHVAAAAPSPVIAGRAASFSDMPGSDGCGPSCGR